MEDQQPEKQKQHEFLVQAFQNLKSELSNVPRALATQGISNAEVKFDGNPKVFRKWIKSIHKYSVLTGANEEGKNSLHIKHLGVQCLDSSKGT